MNIHLSRRAEKYIKACPCDDDTFSPTQIADFFRSNGLRISEIAANAISLLGGKEMRTAYDDIYWLGPRSFSKIFLGKRQPDWACICEDWYPGSVFLAENGSLFFEDDSPVLWFNSIEKLVETQAAVFEAIGDEHDFSFKRVVQIDSVESFAKRMSLRIDESTYDRSVVLTGTGKVAVLHEAAFEKTGLQLAAKNPQLLAEMINQLPNEKNQA